MVPSPGEEEAGTPTLPSGVEDWLVTQVAPGVAAVPLGEETTAIPAFTVEPENQTEWEPAYTPLAASPLPGSYGLCAGACPEATHPCPPGVCPGHGFSP